MRFFNHILGFAAVTLLLACAAEKPAYLEVPSFQTVSATSDYDAVVKVILPEGRGLCTGTQVSRRAVITAAHCTVARGAYRVVTPTATRITHLKENLDAGLLGDTGDLSLLIFSQDLGEDFIPLRTEGASFGEAVRIIGYGCDDIDSKLGTGVKRTGTNRISNRSDFLELVTPLPEKDRRVLGPENLAGSCFGDSGGPMLRSFNGKLRVIGVAHAGGWSRSQLISRYVDLSRSRNRAFLERVDRAYDLGLFDACTQDPESPSCTVNEASVGIVSLLSRFWDAVIAFLR